jgi:hypothetical protein
MPWAVDPYTGKIERAYVQVGTHQFDSGIHSTDISVDNYLRITIDQLTCELCATPYESSNTVSFKMFNLISCDSVEYYNYQPIVPCWERYSI